jgi:general nucleoside transport system ATP-binding protein
MLVHPERVPGPTVPSLALSGITKRYPGVVANDDVSLTLRAGEVHVLLGENGAGKSTLIGVLSGVVRPDQGSITVRGEAVAMRSPRDAISAGIGTVYQHSTLVPTLSVIENLILGQPWHAPMRRAAATARFVQIATRLGVHVAPEAQAGELSLGEQQSIEIIKAMWRGESILVLDEPTSMLPPQGVIELGRLLRRLADDGLAILMVTHKLHEVLEIGDCVSILKRGRLVAHFPQSTFKAMRHDDAIAAILAAMFDRGTEAPKREPRAASRATDDAPPILALDQVSTRARGREVALDAVSFSVAPGEVFGLAGVDGNGQQQLAEVIAGQRSIAAGTIQLHGVDVSHQGVRARQATGLRFLTDDRLGEGSVGAFSVALNLVGKRVGEAPFWTQGFIQRTRINAHARTLIERHDVRTPSAATPIGKLSGGNVQKALFARELSFDPRLVVYHKPTHGLDTANTRAARDLIRKQADAGVAAVVISTELDELLDIADRIGVMYRGRLIGILPNEPGAEARIGALMVGGAA